METIRKGCCGNTVVYLQKILNEKYPIPTNGIFEQQTYLAVCVFQKEAGLPADGIVGKNTWNALLANKTEADESTNRDIDTEFFDFEQASRFLGVEVAAVKAVHEVESGGRSGFLKDGRPVILFEGHIFWNELKKRGIDPHKYSSEFHDILFPKWNRASYIGGSAEYDRLDKAATINKEAALCSASWGMFQIMGFNYKLCGFSTVQEYVEAIKQSANNHLALFVKFIRNTGLDKPLKELDWKTFAEKYNGPGYGKNRYDSKLQAAYLKYKQK
ncbi:N-acetylmuramidase family protein [Dysgonomonas capnocytophagoides]|uniref:N-acetylmuramidase family protein n=1 Tax=Dysgonomonas capnocytophagoides TaxID=45254 RepID=UPI00333F1206